MPFDGEPVAAASLLRDGPLPLELLVLCAPLFACPPTPLVEAADAELLVFSFDAALCSFFEGIGIGGGRLVSGAGLLLISGDLPAAATLYTPVAAAPGSSVGGGTSVEIFAVFVALGGGTAVLASSCTLGGLVSTFGGGCAVEMDSTGTDGGGCCTSICGLEAIPTPTPTRKRVGGGCRVLGTVGKLVCCCRVTIWFWFWFWLGIGATAEAGVSTGPICMSTGRESVGGGMEVNESWLAFASAS